MGKYNDRRCRLNVTGFFVAISHGEKYRAVRAGTIPESSIKIFELSDPWMRGSSKHDRTAWYCAQRDIILLDSN